MAAVARIKPTHHAPKRGRGKSQRRRGMLNIILGIAVLLFPIVSTLYTDYQLDTRARSYAEKVREIEPSELIREYLHKAHVYNQNLAESGHHAFIPTPESPGYDEYLDILNPPETSGMIARLAIPSLDIDLPVYHTTRPEVLYHGAGHMFGSDVPVGGPGTNSVISAHTGMVNASMFDNLPRIKDGAEIYLDVLGEVLVYRVTGRQVVAPDDYQAVTYEAGVDKLTLITCTPYGINTDRLLVSAERVPREMPEISQSWRPVLSWWMMIDLIIIALVIAFVLWREWQRRKENTRDADSSKD
ncbi:class C sortase [Corynebacterium sp. ES2794-CONJ1]|uniref:class C sortase n=1 Tax=unclassified Corynebacterium TaxID=2624378 RepID=UPI0021684FF2|nr:MULTISPECIES: class C sortase [unclassified Corynebacterium]MCS4492312.1 class C sortase [Corynebacterium sp. ES2715-CONJ3]MCS4532496.1 class C sortase [Corynebacterium sp. ES2730-CONJ]MCU9519891.1 class C sortase [Corynebacterium sp. ES2794-CONJ1]